MLLWTFLAKKMSFYGAQDAFVGRCCQNTMIGIFNLYYLSEILAIIEILIDL